MGNRGCLHDAQRQIRHNFRGQRWIICLLEFKGRKRTVMTPGQYTELFFLDEATALAAGHRPCAECQRERFNLFRRTWSKANPELTDGVLPSAPSIDAILHMERLASGAQEPRFCKAIEELPDGVFVTNDEETAYLVWKHQLLKWTPAGYEYPMGDGTSNPLRILTPQSVVRTVEAGYPVHVHPSAMRPGGEERRK